MMKSLLIAAPPGHLDPTAIPLIRKWNDPEPSAAQVLEVLDHCARYALASNFTMSTLNMLLEQAIKREGTTYEDVVKNETWRKDMQ